MKPTRISLLDVFSDRGVRRNVWALLKAMFFIVAVVAVYSVLFHLIMVYVEHRPSTLFTGVYWTLTTMSTVGYGDVVLESNLGRLFAIVVLMTGLVLFLVVLPFTVIRFFYAPWLEAQVRKRTPRQVPPSTKGHVIICAYDAIAASIIERLDRERIPYFVIETDQEAASDHYFAGVSVVMGAVDDKTTYEGLRVDQARMVFANAGDSVNTNIALTVREVSKTVPIVALAHDEYAGSDIGTKTGLNVIAVEHDSEFITSPPASTVLRPGAELLMFGDAHQRRHFADLFGEA